jgi:hypothetical protein
LLPSRCTASNVHSDPFKLFKKELFDDGVKNHSFCRFQKSTSLCDKMSPNKVILKELQQGHMCFHQLA